MQKAERMLTKGKRKADDNPRVKGRWNFLGKSQRELAKDKCKLDFPCEWKKEIP